MGRTRAGDRLRTNGEFLHALLEHAPLGVLLMDMENRLLEANPFFLRLLGVPWETLRGRRLEESLHHAGITDALADARTGGSGHFAGTVFVGGRDAELRLDATRLPGRAGAEPALLVLMEDLSETQAMERQLRERDELLQAFFAQSLDGFYIATFDEPLRWDDTVDKEATLEYALEHLRITRINQAMLDQYGWKESDMIGVPTSHFYKHDRVQNKEDLRALLESGHRHIETCERRADGSIVWFEGDYIVLYDENGLQRGHFGVQRDISERKQAEDERRALEAQMLQAQKLESLGVLAGGIAHDFNNLLTAVLGNINLAQSVCGPGNPSARYLEAAERTLLKAADLTRQMLAYSGRGSFAVEPLDLNALVQEMSHLLAVSIPKKTILNSHLEPELPWVHADASQLQQVVLNLVTNAAESIGENQGRIDIVTGRERLAAGTAAVLLPSRELEPGEYVFLEVADTGCGIAPELLEKIFDPFFSTKRAGRGLGLSSMVGILRAHRGGIRIHSQPGRGSTFRVYLPAGLGTIRKQEIPVAGESPKLTGTVLLVDDEPAILETGAGLLSQLGFQVRTARDGQEAVALFSVDPAAVDLVLMDITMPRLGGREACLAMRALRPMLPVLLSSGYDERESLRDLPRQGVTGFLKKPYRVQELRQAIIKILPGTSGSNCGGMEVNSG